MVTRVSSITGLTRNGVKDFLVQRVSAVLLGLYLLTLITWVIVHPQLSFTLWAGLFSGFSMKFFTLLALISLMAHAWIGMWTIFTDYITCSWLRGLLVSLMMIGFLGYLVLGIMIVWG